jgi:hypothetical protein
MNTPKKYGKGYKLFEQRSDGKLFPLFIGKNEETIIGEWIPAENITHHPGFSSRPGWHCSMSTPDAPWLRGYDGSELGPYKSRFKNGKRVWCEVLYDMTNDYRTEALKQPKKCFVDRVPENGFYWFKESNRWKHLLGGFGIGLFSNCWYCAAYAGAGVGGAMELKDKLYGNKFDWIDLSLTFGGSLLGYFVRTLVLSLL